MDPISELQLSIELQELYLQNKEWMSHALFLSDENRFFQKLFSQNLFLIGKNHPSSQVDLVGAALEKQGDNIIKLKDLILKHQHVLERVLKDPEQKVSILLIEEHGAITAQVQELLQSDRIIKSELFILVEEGKV
jgi:hypothetical protein